MDVNKPENAEAESERVILELLTSEEVAATLRTTRDLVFRLCREGQLGFVQVGREKRFTRDQVLEFVDRQTRRPWAAGEPARRGGNIAGREF